MSTERCSLAFSRQENFRGGVLSGARIAMAIVFIISLIGSKVLARFSGFNPRRIAGDCTVGTVSIA